jgi:hypothetical protein
MQARPAAMQAAVVAAACLAVALLATWPMPARIATALPVGAEPQGTVQLYSLWTLWWNADRLAHGFAHYWDAPIFHPHRGVFAYSEPEPLIGVAVAPLWALGAPPALIHNVALLMILTLNGGFTFRLARALGASWLPALLGGALAVSLPFVAREYGITNLTPLFGMLWTLDGIVRFGGDARWRWAAWAATGLLATFLTCLQYLVMFAPFAAAAAAMALSRHRFRPRPAFRLGLPLALSALAILLLALPMLAVHAEMGFERPDYMVHALSAEPEDFATRPATSWLPFPPPYHDDTGGLFPGVLLLALALVGAVWSIVDGHGAPESRAWTLYLVASVIMAAVLALGLNLRPGGISPYGVLREIVPGYSQMRTPFRFAVIVQLPLPVLAALAFTRIQRRVGRRSTALVLPLAGFAVLENTTLPNPVMSLPLRASSPWTTWLRAQPEGTVIAHVPFRFGTSVRDYESDGWRMLAQTHHHKPMINGFSSYFPPRYGAFQRSMARSFPTRALLCRLHEELGADLLVADKPWLLEREARMAAFSASLAPVFGDEQVQIYRLRVSEEDCVGER